MTGALTRATPYNVVLAKSYCHKGRAAEKKNKTWEGSKRVEGERNRKQKSEGEEARAHEDKVDRSITWRCWVETTDTTSGHFFKLLFILLQLIESSYYILLLDFIFQLSTATVQHWIRISLIWHNQSWNSNNHCDATLHYLCISNSQSDQAHLKVEFLTISSAFEQCYYE